jgi:cytochrome c oxidase cbb3-type subunit III
LLEGAEEYFTEMNFLRSTLHRRPLPVVLLSLGLAVSAAQTSTPGATTKSAAKPSGPVARKPYPPALIQSGNDLFQRDCSFCHGRDGAGGETGPDLTRSKLVTEDVGGNKIGGVVRNGRPERGMPRFNFSDQEIAGLMAFIHTQQHIALTQKGGRRGVDVADLQTGNVDAGKHYFEGAGGCATCHSPSGDLAGIASRFKGLQLEEQMLYPRHTKSKVTVTLASGETITGTLNYLDEFTIGLIDPTGNYRSWRTGNVQYKIDRTIDAHSDLLSKYTDDDIHNLMAYLQTLK